MKPRTKFVLGALGLVAGLVVLVAFDRRNTSKKRGQIRRIRHREALLDEALEESFPASDPVSVIFN